MSRNTIATIDLQALRHNLDAVRRFAPKSKILAMVKADGYGHGLVRVANGLQDADAFGVACLDEALRLRQAGIKQPIVLMEGPLGNDEIPQICQHHLDLVLHHPSQLTMLQEYPPTQPISVWIKIETGMHRLGFAENRIADVYQWCQQHPQFVSNIRLMSHFAQAEAVDPHFTQQQLDTFTRLTHGLAGERSMANSAGIIGWPAAHMDWVRPGIMLYGISPIAEKIGQDYGLQPVMRLQSKVIAVNELKAGDKIGYGCHWTAPEATPVCVVAIGYGDGYPRHIPNGAPVSINGRILPIVGHLSMDMLTVDCRTYPQVKVGDTVMLWGAGLPVERIAQAAETIAYECVTQVTGRVIMQVQ